MGSLGSSGRKAVSITSPAGWLPPGSRTMIPPGGVGVSGPTCRSSSAFESKTAPCPETCRSMTGFSGKAASMSRRVMSRLSARPMES